MYNWSIESDPNYNADRLSPAYIAQEADAHPSPESH